MLPGARRVGIARALLATLLAGAFGVWAAAPVTAQMHQPDATLHDAQAELRSAARDTAGHGSDPARLDSLGVALLRLVRENDARTIFTRVTAIDSTDAAAHAGLGRLALVHGRLAEAESLFTRSLARERDPAVVHDLFVTHLRQHDYAAAAALAEEAGEPGRADALRSAAETPPYTIAAGPDEVRIPFAVMYPVPCIRVKLNGNSVLLAIDSGARDLVLDSRAAGASSVQASNTESAIDWMGRRFAVNDAVVRTLEIGAMRIEHLPAGLTPLRSFGLQLNLHSEPVIGVIGIELLRAFTPTIDYPRMTLVLRRPGVAWSAGAGAKRVPFEVWGEHALMVPGTVNGGRRTMLQVHSGIPECGFAAPTEVFTEAGLKSGAVSRTVKGATAWFPGFKSARVNVPGITAGDVISQQVAGWAMECGPDPLWRYGMRSDGYLSHDFFRPWRVTFDWSGQALVFEPKR